MPRNPAQFVHGNPGSATSAVWWVLVTQSLELQLHRARKAGRWGPWPGQGKVDRGRKAGSWWVLAIEKRLLLPCGQMLSDAVNYKLVRTKRHIGEFARRTCAQIIFCPWRRKYLWHLQETPSLRNLKHQSPNLTWCLERFLVAQGCWACPAFGAVPFAALWCGLQG